MTSNILELQRYFKEWFSFLVNVRDTWYFRWKIYANCQLHPLRKENYQEFVPELFVNLFRKKKIASKTKNFFLIVWHWIFTCRRLYELCLLVYNHYSITQSQFKLWCENLKYLALKITRSHFRSNRAFYMTNVFVYKFIGMDF